MSVRKFKGSWWVDFTHRMERLRRRSPLNTKGGAQEFEITLRRLVAEKGSVSEFLAAEIPQIAEQPLTFAEFSERWMREYVAVNNKASEQYTKRIVLARQLLPVFGPIFLAAITRHSIEQYKAHALASGLSPKSVNNYLTILRTCLQTAVDWDMLSAVPRFKLLRAPQPSFRYLRHEEVVQLVDAADGVWRDMILLGARTGLRLSELIALDWQDLDLPGRMLTVRHAVVAGRLGTPKNHRVRHVPLTYDIVAALTGRRQASGRVLIFHGRPIAKQTASRHLHAICQRASLAPHGWHVLRHTFASHLAQLGVPAQVMMDLLGHSSLTMVLRYAHLSPQTYGRAIAQLETAIPIPRQPAGNQALQAPPEASPAQPDHAISTAQPSQNNHAGAWW